MQLITQHSVRRSRWRHLADEEVIGQGKVTVSLQRWLLQRDLLLARFKAVGVRLAPADAVADIAPDIPRLALIALDVSDYQDGRSYTQARLLRERFGYRGELRALQARRDHLALLRRCGVDVFELHPLQDGGAAVAELRQPRTAYQPAADGLPLIFRRRRHPSAIPHTRTEEGADRR